MTTEHVDERDDRTIHWDRQPLSIQEDQRSSPLCSELTRGWHFSNMELWRQRDMFPYRDLIELTRDFQRKSNDRGLFGKKERERERVSDGWIIISLRIGLQLLDRHPLTFAVHRWITEWRKNSQCLGRDFIISILSPEARLEQRNILSLCVSDLLVGRTFWMFINRILAWSTRSSNCRWSLSRSDLFEWGLINRNDRAMKCQSALARYLFAFSKRIRSSINRRNECKHCSM